MPRETDKKEIDKRKIDKRILTVVVASLLTVGGVGGYMLLNPEPGPTNGGQNFSIASWNLQIFGPTKGADETLLNYYSDKLDEYDMFIVQEIRDISGEAIENLAAKLPAYEYILSERAGRSSSKEQYAIFYNSRATLVSQYDWTPERQNDFERPPFQATFTVESWTFTLYTIHVKPSDVPNELTYLEEIVGDPQDDTIILGDLNADGTYYDEDNREHFTDWNWVITNEIDTTVAASDNTYDRIIINDAVENNFISAGVMNDVETGQSDHYLVYGVFDPDESSEEPPTEHPENQLIINEFESNPTGSDSGNEWVELYNPTDHTLTLMGWNLQNNDGDYRSFSGTVHPNFYVVIDLPGQWLDNSDERVILLNSDNQEIDSTPNKADSSDDDNTWSRIPNGVDTDSESDWVFQIGTFGQSNTESENPLLINEFELNPTGSDSGNEWIELFNPGENTIDLTSWSLKNNDDEVYPLSGTISPDGYVTIIFSGAWLDNSDEKVILLNPSSQEIDVTPIKADSSNDHNSWSRVPNGVDTDSESDWVFQPSTSGYYNSESEEPPQSHLLINEFELNPAGSDSGNEWIELFNPTDIPIDLIGWNLMNNDDDIYSLSGSIDSNVYKVITFSSQWLDNTDEKVILLNPSSQEIDVTSIKADGSNDDSSWQRIPNGSDTDSNSDWTFHINTQGNSNGG